jgi:hypothetical protein
MSSNPKHRIRIPYIGAGPLLAAVVISAGAVYTWWPFMHGHDVFPDPVAGNIAWTNTFKGRDFITLGAGLGLIAILAPAIAMLCGFIADGREEMESPLNDLLLVSVIPFVWRCAVACAFPVNQFPPLLFVGIFPLVAVICLVLLARHRSSLQSQQVLGIGGAIGIGLLFSCFAGLGVMTAICRLIPSSIVHLHDKGPVFAWAGIAIYAVFVLVGWFQSTDAVNFESRMLAGLKWVQFALPLLFYNLLPPPMADPLHHFANPFPVVLTIALTASAGLAGFFIWHRGRRVSSLTDVVAPISIALLVTYIYCGAAGLPRALGDYFHFGEQTVPWQQLWDFHARPYIDFVPVHGLMPMLRGALSQFFFDGSVASYEPCDILLTGLAGLALGLSMSMLTGSVGALFLLLGYFPYLDRMYFFMPALFVVASPSLWKRPARLLIVWIVLCVLMVAYSPTMGPAFAVATVPLALVLMYRLLRDQKLQLGLIIFCVAAMFALAWVIHPVREMGIAFSRFISGNAWSNEIAHGIAWDEEYGQRNTREGPGSTQLSFELVRNAWMPVGLLALGMFWAELGRKREDRRPALLILAGSAPPAMLLTVPWVLGRIDGQTLGRTGSLAHAAVYDLLPALVLLHCPRQRLMPTLLVLAGVVGYLYSSNPTCSDPDNFLNNAGRLRIVPDDAQVVDGKNIGIPRLGQVIKPTPNYLNDILLLKRDLNEFLRPGETYIDLTNQTMLYLYLNLRCPTRYAPFVAANSMLQSGELQQLRDHPEPVALIYPAVPIDTLPVPLRCYEVYRELALKYVAVKRDQYVFLVDPSRLTNPPAIGSPDQIELIEPYLTAPNLDRLPVSWGQSWSHMKTRFDPVAPVAVTTPVFSSDVELQNGRLVFSGEKPYWEYAIPPAVKDGATADFLRFHYEDEAVNARDRRYAQSRPVEATAAGPEPAMSCRWIGSDGRDSEAITFKASNGDLLLPLGAYPRWLLGKSPLRLRFDFLNPGCAKWVRISGMEFVHLKTMPNTP